MLFDGKKNITFDRDITISTYILSFRGLIYGRWWCVIK